MRKIEARVCGPLRERYFALFCEINAALHPMRREISTVHINQLKLIPAAKTSKIFTGLFPESIYGIYCITI